MEFENNFFIICSCQIQSLKQRLRKHLCFLYLLCICHFSGSADGLNPCRIIARLKGWIEAPVELSCCEISSSPRSRPPRVRAPWRCSQGGRQHHSSSPSGFSHILPACRWGFSFWSPAMLPWPLDTSVLTMQRFS